MCVNGVFDRVPDERTPGGPPVYRMKGECSSEEHRSWIYLASDNSWAVGNTENKDERRSSTSARLRTFCTVADKLPHELGAAAWVDFTMMQLVPVQAPVESLLQKEMAVRAVTTAEERAEADRLVEAEWRAHAEADLASGSRRSR